MVNVLFQQVEWWVELMFCCWVGLVDFGFEGKILVEMVQILFERGLVKEEFVVVMVSGKVVLGWKLFFELVEMVWEELGDGLLMSRKEVEE